MCVAVTLKWKVPLVSSNKLLLCLRQCAGWAEVTLCFLPVQCLYMHTHMRAYGHAGREAFSDQLAIILSSFVTDVMPLLVEKALGLQIK